MTLKTAQQLRDIARALGLDAELKGPLGRVTQGAGCALRIKGVIASQVLESDSREFEFSSFWSAKLFLQGALSVLKPAGGKVDLEEPEPAG